MVLMRLFTLLCSLPGASPQQQAGIFCIHHYISQQQRLRVCVSVLEKQRERESLPYAHLRNTH